MINRRQFLWLGGGLAGFGTAILADSYNLARQTSQSSRIVVISDLNSSYGSTDYEPEVKRAIALLPQWNPDLVVCAGDMVAGQKLSLSESQIRAMWQAFEQHVAAPIRSYQLPLAITIGNHDGSSAVKDGKMLFETDRRLAAEYWQSPQHSLHPDWVDRGNFPFYYSFLHRDVFYLVWDASSHLIESSQLGWVEENLGSRTAQQAKMRMVIGHLPLYAVSQGRDEFGNYLEQAQQLQSLLETYNVHTYISGHHHAYFPGKQGQLELLSAGALGSGPRQLINTPTPPKKTATIVDIVADLGTTEYTTYDLSSLEIISYDSLPPAIAATHSQILRRDLA